MWKSKYQNHKFQIVKTNINSKKNTNIKKTNLNFEIQIWLLKRQITKTQILNPKYKDIKSKFKFWNTNMGLKRQNTETQISKPKYKYSKYKSEFCNANMVLKRQITETQI